MSTETIQLVEVLWMIAAVPGLVVWSGARVAAGRALRAAKRAGVRNGRLAVARYEAWNTTTFVAIELVFVLIGLVAMTTVPSPNSGPARLVISAGLIGASAAITVLGLAWRRVNNIILAR